MAQAAAVVVLMWLALLSGYDIAQ
ncbi:prepilin peptidase, partial [Mycolicibacter senuensis]